MLSLTSTEDVTYLGVRMQQNRADFLLWEFFFYRHHAKVQHVLELGTYIGGFSIYLLLQCIQYNLRFNTYDHKDLRNETKIARELHLERHFTKLDLLSEANAKSIMSNCLHPALVYCDNGNKPKEMKLFSKYAQRGDIFAVHDWNIEFFPQHKPANLEYMPDMQEEAASAGSLTRFFTVKEDLWLTPEL